MDTIPGKDPLEERIHKLEERLDLLGERAGRGGSSLHPVGTFLPGLIALVFGYFGMGLPQHYYHFLFAALLLALFYHRGFLRPARGRWRWPQIAANFLVLCSFFKLLIGGGTQHPFDWLKAPEIIKAPPTGDSSWYNRMIPDFTVQWQSIPHVSDWSFDLTKIQTLLLIATLAGALFRFQPFTSITALALLIISIPVYLQFNWDWVVLFLVLGSVSLYLQTSVHTRAPDR
jgi:hypothetical protein